MFLFLRHMYVTNADNQIDKIAAAAQKILTAPESGPGLCPVRDILDRVGDKWSLFSILHL